MSAALSAGGGLARIGFQCLDHHMSMDLPKSYEPNSIEAAVTERWLEARAFSAVPDERPRDRRYVIMMPLPNVTGALHFGHAMDNVMQDLLIRWHRMTGDNTLWQPGTDHAGIATQAVVEKRLYELEGMTRRDLGREALVERIFAWKDEYQRRIIRQQQRMGCSADWDRQRFTMDPVCTAALREVFFRLFRDRLIYHGDRLVNWDCQLQTAVSDDEVYHEPAAGHLWYLRYPVIGPEPGEPEYVVVATTRPETMLGDTAVACHPEPRRALEERIAEQAARVSEAPEREKEEARDELARLEARRALLPDLERLAEMARAGRTVRLPLLDRPIPLILDEWAKPEVGSGSVKITPAHDHNDYAVWQRHRDRIGITNVLQPDGTLNDNAGAYAGLDRFEARDRVVRDLEAKGLLDAIEDHEVEIGHSDRSKTPIEPYLSKQWFVFMGDRDGGILCGRGTGNEFEAAGLAQVAIDAAGDSPRNPSGRTLTFHPSRYDSGYVAWLAEKRDWCISRQLWWGHRIPVWTAGCESGEELMRILNGLPEDAAEQMCVWVSDPGGLQMDPDSAVEKTSGPQEPLEVQVCLRNQDAEARYASALEDLGLEQDPDVLDTWFSSALWPFSTLGWPDPDHASVGEGQTPLGAPAGGENAFSYYYPGSCLVTGRDIITLWVARMLVLGLYTQGDVPFTDCFIHAKILDGNGVTMSKSKGNGIDPSDIIERYGADAMRYVVCDIETGMQDVRLPVQADCPSCRRTVELAEANHGKTIFTYLCPSCGSEFDVLGTMPDVPSSQVFSDRFEIGRNFCNKLWNAARFVLANLEGYHFRPLTNDDLAAEDLWILSRLSRAIRDVSGSLAGYRPSAALARARDFFWTEFCDWYLEMAKRRMPDPEQSAVARQVLAAGLDQLLRLLHPFVPFITEQLWEYLNGRASKRGIHEELPRSDLCVQAQWPVAQPQWEDATLEEEFEVVKTVVSSIRELRSRHGVPPTKRLAAAVRAEGSALTMLLRHEAVVAFLSQLSQLEIGAEVGRPPGAAAQVVGGAEVFLGGVLDPDKERGRLRTQIEKLTHQLDSSRRKLANQGFVTKAPAQVVEAEKKRAADLETRIALLTRSLDALE